jgi:hypothetical protein
MTDYMKFANSTVYTVKLLADTPEQYDGNFGLQNNYSCEWNGKPITVSQKVGSGLDLYLDGGKAGDVFVIEKRQDPANPKNFPFHVEKGESVAGTPTPAQGETISRPAEPQWDMINAVKTWHINKSDALRGAIDLSDNSAQVGDLYHEFFSLLRSDALLIVDRINRCTSLAQLEALWKDEGALWVELIGLDKMSAIQRVKAAKVETFPKPKVEPPPPPATPGYEYGEDPLPF